ncbi:MAG: DUF6529 family protein [Thermoleophilia bacterium]
MQHKAEEQAKGRDGMLELTFSQKSLLATVLLVIACLQLTVMAMVLGKIGSFSPDTRQRLTLFHRFEGYVGFIVVLWVAYNCVFNVVNKSGAPRVVIHMLMGMIVIGLIMGKITISRGLKQFYTRLPLLGASLFTAITILWVTSAGWYYYTNGTGY